MVFPAKKRGGRLERNAACAMDICFGAVGRDRQADEAVRAKSNSENARIVRDRILRRLTEERSTELRKGLERNRQ